MLIYPHPFFVAITQLFSLIIFINDCICILSGSPGYYFLMIVYVIQKIGGNENSPNSLNVMVNHHYRGKNTVITQYFPSMRHRMHQSLYPHRHTMLTKTPRDPDVFVGLPYGTTMTPSQTNLITLHKLLIVACK